MCNDYELKLRAGQWEWVKNNAPRYQNPNVASFEFYPDDLAPIIRYDKEGELEMVEARWGLPPKPGEYGVLTILTALSAEVTRLLDFLEEVHLTPGITGTVTAASPDGTVTVEVDGRTVGVGSFASQRILVTAG